MLSSLYGRWCEGDKRAVYTTCYEYYGFVFVLLSAVRTFFALRQTSITVHIDVFIRAFDKDYYLN